MVDLSKELFIIEFYFREIYIQLVSREVVQSILKVFEASLEVLRRQTMSEHQILDES